MAKANEGPETFVAPVYKVPNCLRDEPIASMKLISALLALTMLALFARTSTASMAMVQYLNAIYVGAVNALSWITHIT